MLKRFKKFLHNEQGLAFLEFAISAPFIIMLLMGSIEVTRYILIAQKVEKTASTLSDVVAQGQTINTATMNNIITAARQVMNPYNFGNSGFVIISSVTQTGSYTVSNPPMVNWQYTSSGSNGSWTQASRVGSMGQRATLPNGFTLNDKDNIIIAEVFFNYQPLVGNNPVVNSATIYRLGLYKPRLGALTTLGP